MTNLYALYDSKAEHYLPIMEAKNHAHAIRTVADAIAQGIKALASHPEDYNLFMICSYDAQTGYVTQDQRPERVASVQSIIDTYFKTPAGSEEGVPHSLTNGEDLSPPPDADSGPTPAADPAADA